VSATGGPAEEGTFRVSAHTPLFGELLAGRLGTELHPCLLRGLARGPRTVTKDRRAKGRSVALDEHDVRSEALESRLGFSLGRDHVSFDVDETVYPLEAIYGGSYLFVDRCFVFLSRPSPRVVNVRLTSRGPATPAELDALAGEFVNELLSQATRLRLSEATVRIREYYTAAALRAAAAAPSVDDLLAELDSEELGDDPLDIVVPWEGKHGVKEPEPK
jgi:His-Xaa-Ser system protein HxsD